VCALLATLLTACGGEASTTIPVTLRLAAPDLAAPLLSDLIAAYAPSHPEVSLAAVIEPGAPYDLVLTAFPETGSFATPVGYVSLALVANPQNPAAGLSAAQTREMFAGRLTDWAQVGGAPGAVTPVVREDGAEGARSFAAQGFETITPNALVAPTWEAMRAQVAQTPGALGYLPLPEIDASVKVLALDVPMRVLIVAASSAEPTGAARDFIAWAQSEAGQAVVAQRYESIR
jgi:ABC-type phosphate transport system substrate-binding protein